MQETLEFIRLVDRVSIAVTQIPQRAATHAVNFSKERFRSQNWVDNYTEPWKKRKIRDKRSGRAILVDTGQLRRSIRKIIVTNEYAVIGTNVPYARAHNDGFRGKVVQNVRAHKRNLTKFGITKRKQLKRSTRIEFGRVVRGSVTVKAHKRTINLNLPRRRFIGASAVLNTQIQRIIIAEITRAIKAT